MSRATSTTEAFSIARNRESVADIKQQERERDLQLLAKKTVEKHREKNKHQVNFSEDLLPPPMKPPTTNYLHETPEEMFQSYFIPGPKPLLPLPYKMPKWSEFNKPQAPLPQGPTMSEMIQTEVQKQVLSLLPSMQQNNSRVQARWNQPQPTFHQSAQRYQPYAARNNNNKSTNQTTKFDGECFNCGKSGHRAVECWSKPRPRNNNNNNYYNNNNNNYKRSPVATTQRVAPTPQQPPVNSSQL